GPEPKEPALPTTTVPAVTVVPPVWVLAPGSTTVPVPFRLSKPLPPTGPAKVVRPVALFVRVAVPTTVVGPAKVRLLPWAMLEVATVVLGIRTALGRMRAALGVRVPPARVTVPVPSALLLPTWSR